MNATIGVKYTSIVALRKRDIGANWRKIARLARKYGGALVSSRPGPEWVSNWENRQRFEFEFTNKRMRNRFARAVRRIR